MKSTLLQLAGLLLLAFGLWMQWPWVGVTVAGFVFVLLGVTLEIEGRRRAREPD